MAGEKVTGDTITDEQIREYFCSIPYRHYAMQWCIDALQPSSPSHPHRRRNARRAIAELIGRAAEGSNR